MKIKAYVLDTSALLALLDNEAGANQVLELLHLAVHGDVDIYMSIISVVELRYRLIRQKDIAFADKKVAEVYEMPLQVVEFGRRFVNQAALCKATGKMSFADACIAALAKDMNAILVHKDPEYTILMQDIQQLALPFKPKNI